MGKKVYGVADKAWQPLVGCDPAMPCAPRCWARRTIARVAECQKATMPDPERAKFFAAAVTRDGQRWSGKTFLDPEHLREPLTWRKPALVATGFHGDIGRLSREDMLIIFQQIGKCPRHTFMLLTKCPQDLLRFLDRRWWRLFGAQPRRLEGTMWAALIPGEHRENDSHALPNVTIGVSIMNQADADEHLSAMKALSVMGWRTHVWYEPAIGPVDWKGWEFIERLIVGGESGPGARPFVDNWAYRALDWCRNNGVAFWMKQLGSNPVDSLGKMRGAMFSKSDKKGKEWESLPALLRVREEVPHAL